MLLNNSRVRRRLAVRNPISIKIALPLDDHRKLETFVALLAQIDKRNSPSTPRLRRTRANGKETKSRDPTKAKDALLGQYRKGSLKYGPIFLKQLLYSYKNSIYLTTDIHHEEHIHFFISSFLYLSNANT